MLTELKIRKLVIFFGGLALFAVALAVTVNFALTRMPAEEPRGGALPPLEQEPVPTPGAVRFVNPGAADERPISYTDAGFSPREVAIQARDAVGCLISVINRSSRSLRVGVSPHAAGGDPGADYGEIAPGATLLLDVRYPGLVSVALHNHAKPEQDFTVHYEEGCK